MQSLKNIQIVLKSEETSKLLDANCREISLQGREGTMCTTAVQGLEGHAKKKKDKLLYFQLTDYRVL